MAQALASLCGHLSEELQHLGAVERQKTYFVLKGSHVEYVAVSNVALDERGTYAPHVVNTKVGLLTIQLAGPYHDVRQQV